MLINHPRNHFLGSCANHAFLLFATFEENQRWYPFNSVTLRDGRIVVNVNLNDPRPFAILFRDRDYGWVQHATGSAPRGPEIHQHRRRVLQYIFFKAAIVNFTQGLAQERDDLIVNVVAPSRIASEMRKNQFAEEDPSTMLTPEEVAAEIFDLLQRGVSFASVVEIMKG